MVIVIWETLVAPRGTVPQIIRWEDLLVKEGFREKLGLLLLFHLSCCPWAWTHYWDGGGAPQIYDIGGFQPDFHGEGV